MKRKRQDSSDGAIFHLDLPIQDDIDWTNPQNKWVAATATKNYILEDGFLDLLSHNPSSLNKKDNSYQKEFVKLITQQTRNNGDNFVSSLFEKGNEFERKVIELITKTVGEENVKNIGGSFNPRSKEKYLETIESMKNGIPIIYNSVVRNYKKKLHGMPDILIRSDWINRLIEVPPLHKKEIKSAMKFESKKIPVSEIRNKTKWGRIGKRLKRINDIDIQKRKNNYHYVVIDIKYSIIHLKTDAIHLRKKGLFEAYKGQLWIYNQCIGEMQGYLPKKVFLLGSGWKYQKNGIKYFGNNCLERVGTIDFSDHDKYINVLAKEAIDWVRDVREKGHTWDLSETPLPREELYPNMCNRHDFPFHGVKKRFASDIKEITLVWNCGTKHRKISHSKNIYSWDDPRCNINNLGITGDYTRDIVSKILEINQSNDILISPNYIKNNYELWKEKDEIEFFVDFEMTCSVFNDMDEFPEIDKNSYIFLIGVGHIENGKWTFKYFIVNEINDEEENRICEEFIEYIDTYASLHNITPKLYHWSHAEPTAWKRAEKRSFSNPFSLKTEKVKILAKMSRQFVLGKNISVNKLNDYYIIEGNKKDIEILENSKWITVLDKETNQKIKKNLDWNLKWVDMLKIFKKEPIVVNGSLNFSLKNIARAMNLHGFINSIWDNGSSCTDGPDAAVNAYKVNKECKRNGISFSNSLLAKEIVKYNEVDCKVLEEIIRYLRENLCNEENNPEKLEFDEDELILYD